MKTPPAARDLEAAVPADSAAAAAAQQQLPAATKKVAEEEDPRIRWAFVRKVYGILSLQFVLTAAVAATAWLVPAIPRFFAYGPRAAVWPTVIVMLVFPLIVMFAMFKYTEKHPTSNRVLLALFTFSCSLSIAVSACSAVVSVSSTADIVVLQATILTVLGLTLFTFWAAKRGYDFSSTFPRLLSGLNVVLVYIIVVVRLSFLFLSIVMCSPVSHVWLMVAVAICGFLATLVFSGFVVIILDGGGDMEACMQQLCL